MTKLNNAIAAGNRFDSRNAYPLPLSVVASSSRSVGQTVA